MNIAVKTVATVGASSAAAAVGDLDLVAGMRELVGIAAQSCSWQM